MKDNCYYVYAFLRECDSYIAPKLTPYYIGKGKHSRFLKSSNRRVLPPKDKSLIVFIASGLTEKEAFNLEKFCIRLYGRVDNSTGILRNMTDGGEGLSGYLFSEEERAKRSDRAKNRKPEENPMKGKSHTQQHKEYMSAIMTGANNPFYGQKTLNRNATENVEKEIERES